MPGTGGHLPYHHCFPNLSYFGPVALPNTLFVPGNAKFANQVSVTKGIQIAAGPLMLGGDPNIDIDAHDENAWDLDSGQPGDVVMSQGPGKPPVWARIHHSHGCGTSPPPSPLHPVPPTPPNPPPILDLDGHHHHGCATTTSRTPTVLKEISFGPQTTTVLHVLVHATSTSPAPAEMNVFYFVHALSTDAQGALTQTHTPLVPLRYIQNVRVDARVRVDKDAKQVQVEVVGEPPICADVPELVALLLPRPVRGRHTWTITTEGTGVFLSLSAALASHAVRNGDELLFLDKDTVLYQSETVNKAVTLKGTGKQNTQLTVMPGVQLRFTHTSGSAALSKLALLQGGDGPHDAAIVSVHAAGATMVLDDLVVRAYVPTGVIDISAAASFHMQHCDCTFGGTLLHLSTGSEDSHTIYNCTFAPRHNECTFLRCVNLAGSVRVSTCTQLPASGTLSVFVGSGGNGDSHVSSGALTLDHCVVNESSTGACVELDVSALHQLASFTMFDVQFSNAHGRGHVSILGADLGPLPAPLLLSAGANVPATTSLNPAWTPESFDDKLVLTHQLARVPECTFVPLAITPRPWIWKCTIACN